MQCVQEIRKRTGKKKGNHCCDNGSLRKGAEIFTDECRNLAEGAFTSKEEDDYMDAGKEDDYDCFADPMMKRMT